MLKCNELTEISTEYLEGGLPLGPTLEVYLHLRLCGPCRTYLDQMKTTIQLLRQLSVERTPSAAIHEVLADHRRKRLAGPPAHRRAGTLRPVDS